MKIEIELLGKHVKVRCAVSKNDRVKRWDELFSKGDIHVASGLTYSELVALGDGIHQV